MHDCTRCLASVLPIIPFGIFQAIYVIGLLSVVPTIVTKPELLPIAFSILKVVEGFVLVSFSYIIGWIITHAHFYNVSLMLSLCAFVGYVSLEFMNPPPT